MAAPGEVSSQNLTATDHGPNATYDSFVAPTLDKMGSSAVVARRTQLGVADASGRSQPAALVGENFAIPADLVIAALGFEPEDLPVLLDEGLGVTRNRTLAIDPKRFTTSLEGVFAAGDIVRGASLVVWAIRDGQDAAESMHHYVTAKLDRTIAAAAE